MKRHFTPWSKRSVESWRNVKVPLVVESKTPRALSQIAGILAAAQGPVCRPEWDILHLQIESCSYISHDLSPRWGRKIWKSSFSCNVWGRKSLQVFINRGQRGDAEPVNTWGMSGQGDHAVGCCFNGQRSFLNSFCFREHTGAKVTGGWNLTTWCNS